MCSSETLIEGSQGHGIVKGSVGNLSAILEELNLASNTDRAGRTHLL